MRGLAQVLAPQREERLAVRQIFMQPARAWDSLHLQ